METNAKDKIKFSSTYFSLSLVCLVIIPPLSSLVAFASSLSLRFSVAFQALFALMTFWVLRQDKSAKPRFTVILIFITFIQGIIVGLYYCLIGINSFSKWVEYSTLAIFSVLFIIVGLRISELEKNDLSKIILLMCLSDVVMLIPRVVSIGLDRRSPWGSSLWVCSLVILVFLVRERRAIVYCYVLFILSMIGALISGMRSSLLLSLTGVIVSSAYVLKGSVKIKRLVLLLGLSIGILVIASLLSSSLFSAINQKIQLVERRLESTVLGDKEIHLDEGGEGREEEARHALIEFNRRSTAPSILLGFGHGFTFFDPWDGESAHVHLTPVAFYVRYGIAGLTTYLFTFLLLIWLFIRSFFCSYDDRSRIIFAYRLVALLTFCGSFIAGFLVTPLPWMAIGVALGRERE